MSKFTYIFVIFLMSTLIVGRSEAKIWPTFITTSFSENIAARNGVYDLLKLLDNAGVDTWSLRDTMERHKFHGEGVESSGLTLFKNNSGVTFLSGITIYNKSIVVIPPFDSYTHSIVKEEAIIDLVNRDFYGNGSVSWRSTSDTVVHELLHAMIFRTSCASLSVDKEENLVGQMTAHVSQKVSVLLALKLGREDLADRLYDGLVDSVRKTKKTNKNWQNCYEELDLPGQFPEVGDTEYLTFVEGNPGVPGDGIIITDPLGGPGGLAFGFNVITDSTLSDYTNGLTVSFYTPGRIVEEVFLEFRKVGTLCGTGGDFGDEPLTPAVNGVSGRAMVVTASKIEDIIQNVASACGADPNDVKLDRVAGRYSDFSNMLELDAVAIGFGEGVFPNDSTPAP